MNDSAGAPPFGTYAPSRFEQRVIDFTRGQPDSWLGKRLAFFARRAVTMRLKHPLDVEVFGNRMRLFPFNNVCEKRILFTPQLFDPLERQILAERVKPGYTFIDVGANVGAYALYVAGRAGSGARVFAIEPQPVIFDRLVYNVRANPSGTVKALACAVGDRNGEITLFIDRENQGESSVKIVASEEQETGSVTVPSKTLLSLIKDENLEQVDGLKLDVEGAEDLILVPFFRDAPEELWPKTIILEYGPSAWQTDCVALAKSHGYREIAQTRLNIVLEL